MLRSLPAPPDGDWRVRGNCRNLKDPDVMVPHPSDKETIAAAKRVCDRCPVQERCLDEALRRQEPHGVWGGLTPAERNVLITHVNRAPRPATRKCRHCGMRRPADQVVNQRCQSCTKPAVQPPAALLNAADRIAALKQRQTPDRVIGERLGVTADEVTAARRALGIDSYGFRRKAVAA